MRLCSNILDANTTIEDLTTNPTNADKVLKTELAAAAEFWTQRTVAWPLTENVNRVGVARKEVAYEYVKGIKESVSNFGPGSESARSRSARSSRAPDQYGMARSWYGT